MSPEPPKKTHAAGWLIVKGVVLIATGVLASIGMTFVCLIGRYLQPPDPLGFTQELPAALYTAFFAAMLVWLFFAVRFAWRNRTWLGLSLSAAAFILFAFKAHDVLTMAYPVCNPF